MILEIIRNFRNMFFFYGDQYNQELALQNNFRDGGQNFERQIFQNSKLRILK